MIWVWLQRFTVGSDLSRWHARLLPALVATLLVIATTPAAGALPSSAYDYDVTSTAVASTTTARAIDSAVRHTSAPSIVSRFNYDPHPYSVATNGIPNPQNVANAPRFAGQLQLEEASSVFTESGALRSSVIQNSRPIISGQSLRNPDVIKALTADGSNIADWAKYSTQMFQSPSGAFQVHFYRNVATGATNYTIDYKVVFGAG